MWWKFQKRKWFHIPQRNSLVQWLSGKMGLLSAPSWCDECDLRWSCDIKHEIHMQQKHELECDIYRTSKPETKGDETSADGDQTVADTLFKELLKLIM